MNIYIYIYMEYHHVYMGFSGLWKVLKPPWPRCDAWISPELLCVWEAPRLSWAVQSVNLTVEAGGSESASQQAVLNKNGWTSDEHFGALPLQGWMKPCLGMFWGAATPKNRTDAGRTAQYIAESTCLWCKRAVFSWENHMEFQWVATHPVKFGKLLGLQLHIILCIIFPLRFDDGCFYIVNKSIWYSYIDIIYIYIYTHSVYNPIQLYDT